MPLELVTIPCLSDNYAFLLHDSATGQTALFDAPEHEPILAELAKRNWTLSHIFLTHHHYDHIDGVPGLLEHGKAIVVGAKADAGRLPALDVALSEGDAYDFSGHTVQVFDVPGHTVGHIAFYLPDAGYLFTGDSLMALGCGRLFEGTPEQMFESLGKLSALPENTIVCSGHEYTASNAKFALSVDTQNNMLKARADTIDKLRSEGRFTVPSSLAEEKATNPFLRAHDPALKAAIGMSDAEDIAVFAELRAMKDAF